MRASRLLATAALSLSSLAVAGVGNAGAVTAGPAGATAAGGAQPISSGESLAFSGTTNAGVAWGGASYFDSVDNPLFWSITIAAGDDVVVQNSPGSIGACVSISTLSGTWLDSDLTNCSPTGTVNVSFSGIGAGTYLLVGSDLPGSDPGSADFVVSILHKATLYFPTTSVARGGAGVLKGQALAPGGQPAASGLIARAYALYSSTSYVPPALHLVGSASVTNGTVKLPIHLPRSLAGRNVHVLVKAVGAEFLPITPVGLTVTQPK